MLLRLWEQLFCVLVEIRDSNPCSELEVREKNQQNQLLKRASSSDQRHVKVLEESIPPSSTFEVDTSIKCPSSYFNQIVHGFNPNLSLKVLDVQP